jgi:hypothetical protein
LSRGRAGYRVTWITPRQLAGGKMLDSCEVSTSQVEQGMAFTSPMHWSYVEPTPTALSHGTEATATRLQLSS